MSAVKEKEISQSLQDGAQVSACPTLHAFGSIFPQLSVNEMESLSAFSMKHI